MYTQSPVESVTRDIRTLTRAATKHLLVNPCNFIKCLGQTAQLELQPSGVIMTKTRLLDYLYINTGKLSSN